MERAAWRPVFGVDVPVASLADLVQGKRWAWGDPGRRPSKQLKDKLDLLRLAEVHPEEVEPLLPEAPRAESVANRAHAASGPDAYGGDEEV